MSSDLLARVLAKDMLCQATAVQPADLMRVLEANHADLVVIGAELNQGSWNGFTLANTVGRTYANILIVTLLNTSDHDSVINAFRSGARGVFSREQPMNEFLDCVEHVRRGLIWAGERETSFLLEALRSIPAPNLANVSDTPALTMRELQVVQCAAKGKTNKVIAGELGLSEHTVKNYLFRVFDKLGVSSRVELLCYLTLKGQTFSTTRGSGLEGAGGTH
jgi:two-component system, NarL family, nitrate/nitrite response regulator NarL